MTDFTGGPGFDAFVATALLTLAVIGLSWSVTRELRKARVNAPAEDEQAAEPQGTVEPADAETLDAAADAVDGDEDTRA